MSHLNRRLCTINVIVDVQIECPVNFKSIVLDMMKPSNFKFMDDFKKIVKKDNYLQFYNAIQKNSKIHFFWINCLLRNAAIVLSNAIVIFNSNSTLAPAVVLPEYNQKYKRLLFVACLFHCRMFLPYSYPIKEYKTIQHYYLPKCTFFDRGHHHRNGQTQRTLYGAVPYGSRRYVAAHVHHTNASND